MPWIDTRKTAYGFEYSIGTIPIARAKWVRTVDQGWKLQVATLEATDRSHMDIAYHAEVMPLNEVMKYLHARLERPMPAPVID